MPENRLSNEKLVESLIAFYKSKGADLAYLIKDPSFDKLPLEAKLNAIKTHAKTLHDGSSPEYNKEELGHATAHVTSSFISGVGSGLVGGTLAYKAIKAMNPNALHNIMAHNKSLAATVAVTGILGGMLGGVSGYITAKNIALPRHAVRNQLGVVAKDPSDINALGVLSTEALYNREHSFRHALTNKLIDKAHKTLGDFLPNHAQGVFSREYAAFTEGESNPPFYMNPKGGNTPPTLPR